MEIRAQLEGEDVGERTKRKLDKDSVVIREAMQEAAEDFADEVLFRGTEDIESAGNFGDDWTEALHADITESQRTIRIDVGMQPKGPPVTFWKVFEYGATIGAKNPSGLLWLPFEDDNDVWPSAYGGSLFRTTSKQGTPLLGDKESKEWKYFGVEEVTIPKKFHLHEIIVEEAEKVRENFERLLEGKLDNG